MNQTMIYEVTVRPVASGAESFRGTFIDVPDAADVKAAIAKSVPLLNHVDILNAILDGSANIPALTGRVAEDCAQVTVRSAGVVIGTISMRAQYAFKKDQERELQELIA